MNSCVLILEWSLLLSVNFFKMKKIYYNIAVGLTVINLLELGLRKFTDFGSLMPQSIKIITVILALIFFGIHFYKNPKTK